MGNLSGGVDEHSAGLGAGFELVVSGNKPCKLAHSGIRVGGAARGQPYRGTISKWCNPGQVSVFRRNRQASWGSVKLIHNSKGVTPSGIIFLSFNQSEQLI